MTTRCQCEAYPFCEHASNATIAALGQTAERMMLLEVQATPTSAAPPSLPRKKHSHRCETCNAAHYCYRTRCTKPQRVQVCIFCEARQRHA